jgi:hypothetical protein
MTEQLTAACLRRLWKFGRVGNLPENDSLAWWTHEHLLAKMLLKLPDRGQKRQAVVRRGGSEALKEPTLPWWDVQRSPSSGNALHPASTPESRVDNHSKELPGHGVVQTDLIFALQLHPARIADDADSEPSTKHGQCVSALQRPTATRVAGFGTWKEMGRFVKRGERGIQILAPMIGNRRRNADTAQNTDADGNAKPQPVLIGFRAVYVFDVEQTEGAELPEFEHNISGEVGEQRDRLIDFLAQQNITLEFNERIAPALGVSYGGKIALLPGQSKPEEFVTLVHETAHELLHKAERRTFTTATVRETEAEAVAFIVGQAIGLEMGNASSDYIQMYNGNATLLTESLEVIQRTSAVILAAIRIDESAEPATEREQFAAAS